jgi:hypothetical protein
MKMTLCLLFTVPALVLAGTSTYVAAFSPDDVHFSTSRGYDVVQLARGMSVPDPGKPALPEVPVTLAVPAGARVTRVTATPLAAEDLVGDFNLAPSQPARPFSKPGGRFSPPDPAIYSSDAEFPGRACREYRTGSAAGFRLVSVSLFPLQYRPARGRLTLTTRMLVKVDYNEHAEPVLTLTEGQRDRASASLARLVANPSDLDRFGPGVAVTDLPEISYLVVTNDAMAPELQPFLDYRTSRGLRTEMRTVEWIDRNYPGRDLQERIRNLIIDYFQHRGLSYVLLAGDNLQVPGRRIRLDVFDEQGDIPTDLYYGDLDFSWDSNHNNLFGEMEDSVDLYADVLVGRASVDNVKQVRNFVAKVMTYEGNPAADYIKRSLLPSGWLWRSIGYHGRFVNDSIANITPTGWTDRKMENPPSSAVVADSFDHGFAIFDPAGHGNSGGVYDESGRAIYTSGQANKQRNRRRYALMTSLACDPGDFEAEDCLAEYAMNCDSAGCIGVMMNSRYGWGTPPQMGPSELLCVRFYDFLFNQSEFGLGSCHDRSREAYAGAAQWDALWRWCMTEFNLFGDPALDVWTDAPEQLSIACVDTVRTGNGDLPVTVTSGGGPVSGADVCAWKGPEVFATARTNGSGIVSLPIDPATVGSLSVTATAHNCLPVSKSVVVAAGAPEPYVVFGRCSIDDAGQPNPNGILEPGETGILTLVVTNAGGAAATNARVVLRATSAGASVPDSLAEFGFIGAGDSARTSDLAVAARPDAYPGSTLEFAALVTSDQSSWEFSFGVELGYPGRVCADIDTGAVALTVTASGTVGFEFGAGHLGRGFRYPKNDTSTLNLASFCFTGSSDYVADRFYGLSGGRDADWRLAESVFARAPIWSSHEFLTSAFNDAGHPRSHNVMVHQSAFSIRGADWVILVYDVFNGGSEGINGYAGILADFDVRAGDRFHDLAYTDGGLATAYMRSVSIGNRYVGVKLLSAGAPSYLECIDHGRYVYPDSGLSEDMKYRVMAGRLGTSGSDRPYNWSIAASTGPLDLGVGATRRVAFAFVGAPDSLSYLDACRECQQWYDANVGVEERQGPAAYASRPMASIIRGRLLLPASRVGREASGVLYGITGRKVAELRPGANDISRLPAGVYLLRLTTEGSTASHRVTLVH